MHIYIYVYIYVYVVYVYMHIHIISVYPLDHLPVMRSSNVVPSGAQFRAKSMPPTPGVMVLAQLLLLERAARGSRCRVYVVLGQGVRGINWLVWGDGGDNNAFKIEHSR